MSKNGNLLLNISPRADGTIPQEQQEVLLAIGKWLEANGEAIYCTRPWLKFGEGPAAVSTPQNSTPLTIFTSTRNEASTASQSAPH